MNIIEVDELEHVLKTWFTHCCGRSGRSRSSICTVGQRIRCELVHGRLVAILRGQFDAPEAAGRNWLEGMK